MVALANPAAVATATEIGAGAAGVTGTGAVAGRITGYTKQGLNQAISRDGGRGVSPKAILSAVREPLKVAEQAGGKTVYTGDSMRGGAWMRIVRSALLLQITSLSSLIRQTCA